MTTEKFLIDDGNHREAVEAICECLPQTNVVTTLAFIIKPPNAVKARMATADHDRQWQAAHNIVPGN